MAWFVSALTSIILHVYVEFMQKEGVICILREAKGRGVAFQSSGKQGDERKGTRAKLYVYVHSQPLFSPFGTQAMTDTLVQGAGMYLGTCTTNTCPHHLAHARPHVI